MTKFYNLTKMLAAMMFHKDSPIIPDGALPPESEPGVVLARVRELIKERRINEGENLLFDMLDPKKPVFAAIALDFYAHLSELSEDELKAADFSVEEIGEGIADMMKTYNIKIVQKNDPRVQGANVKKIPIGGAGQIPLNVLAKQPAGTVGAKPPVAPNVLADKPAAPLNVLADKPKGGK